MMGLIQKRLQWSGKRVERQLGAELRGAGGADRVNPSGISRPCRRVKIQSTIIQLIPTLADWVRALILVSVVLLASLGKSDAQWKQLNVGGPWQVWGVAVIDSTEFAGTYAGIYRSTDGGQSWTNVDGAFGSCFVQKGSEILAGTYYGVRRSTDDGITWMNPDSALTSNIQHMVVKDSVIYAGGGGMFRSTDDGTTWTAIENGMVYGQTNVTGLALVGTKLFASTLSGVCETTDGGNEWSTVIGTGSTNDATTCIATYDSTVLVGWVGGIIRSTDAGNTWSGTNAPPYSGEVYSVVMDSAYSYIGTGEGVLICTDRGATWKNTGSGLPVAQVFSVAVTDTDLYATSFANGVYASTDNGANWTYAANGIVGSDITSLSGDGSNVYAVFNLDSVFSSTDNGNSWVADTGLKGAYQINEVTAIGTHVYAAAANGTFVSSDSGKTWDTLNRPAHALVQSGTNLIAASGRVYFSTNGGVSWLLANNSPYGILYLAATGSSVFAAGYYGIYRSTDSGESWVVVDSNLVQISSLAASDSIVVAGRWIMPTPLTDTIPPPPGGLFLSTDNGQTWSSFVNGLSRYQAPQVLAVALHGGDVFAGLTSQGQGGAYYASMFYTSTIHRDHWINTGQGLPLLGISSIYINDSSIFVGIIHEGGIWRAPLSQVTAIEHSQGPGVPQSIHLSQNYPNPFNPSTTIDYSIPTRSRVVLTVYNILGEKVETLVDAFQQAGEHSVNFNASRLASGVYFYRLTEGAHSIAMKMLLLK